MASSSAVLFSVSFLLLSLEAGDVVVVAASSPPHVSRDDDDVLCGAAPKSGQLRVAGWLVDEDLLLPSSSSSSSARTASSSSPLCVSVLGRVASFLAGTADEADAAKTRGVVPAHGGAKKAARGPPGCDDDDRLWSSARTLLERRPSSLTLIFSLAKTRHNPSAWATSAPTSSICDRSHPTSTSDSSTRSASSRLNAAMTAAARYPRSTFQHTTRTRSTRRR
mmetsp:Transcript_5535/g.22969  ORF Transcript_5535/g.22969 Transcript_5535/m.22969 type:complete len:222 (-) Transcript_5535:45-710(-)